jgi:hypothetical protein
VTTSDLAEFRLLRALRAGQPGAFPTLWNAQAGAIWSVIRAMCETDPEAIGWATSFRVELAERVSDLGGDAPLAGQVGFALYEHLRPGFSADAPLPEPPVSPDEAGARRIPPAPRLLYLVDLFFDVPSAAIERVAGPNAKDVLRAVHRLLEPADDTDARLYVHAALMRAAPVDVLLLPPGVGPAPARPRWWIGGVLGALLLGALALPQLLAWLESPDLGALAARHHAAAEDAPLRGSDPTALGLELARRGAPALLTDVPDLTRVGLTLLGARLIDGSESALVLTYYGDSNLWTLHHLLVPPALDAPPPDAPTSEGGLVAREAPGVVLVSWDERSTTWVLGADAPPGAVLERAEDIRRIRSEPWKSGEAP